MQNYGKKPTSPFYFSYIDFKNHSVVPVPFILFKEKADTLAKL